MEYGGEEQGHSQAEGVVIELLKVDLTGSGGKEASIFLVEIDPGGAGGKHYYPGDAFGYILEGSMTLEIAGKLPVTLKPGESGHVPPTTGARR
jgi:quercetin dioxygenase-like cupin family protein